MINYATTVVDATLNNQSQSLVQCNIYSVKTYNSSTIINVRVENHWTGAYGNHPSHIILSKDRYWNIKGDMTTADPIRFNLFFNGKHNSFNYDTELRNFIGPSFVEDSLVVLYRATPNDNWQVYSDAIYNSLGDNTDAYCRFEVENVSASGQFTFGYKLYNASVVENGQDDSKVIIFPNPVKEELNVLNLNLNNFKIYKYIIYDEKGQIVKKGDFEPSNNSFIKVLDLKSGVYIIKLYNQSQGVEFNQKFVKE